MVDRSYIRVTALAVLPNEAGIHHAVMAASDPASGERFHRPLGGGVELGERAVDAVVREIAEELGATLVEPRLLGVLENIFTYDGAPGHEVVFLYAGRLAQGDVVPEGGAEFADNGVPMWVEWRPLDDASIDVPLYPDGIGSLLAHADLGGVDAEER
jgi:ADP-ribose pyrophosphatase YjhB (NUDIX family)